MNLEKLIELARHGRLYPSVILYGASLTERQRSSVDIARALLCESEADARPCTDADPGGRCRHCRRLAWPGAEQFHPDFHVLERDLRTSTSVDGTRKFLRSAYEAPFEARGQVFVIAEAETLSNGAADALLKMLEEPPIRSPRHFLLLTPSRLDLLATLRSRSLSVFLGSAESLDEGAIEEISGRLREALKHWTETSSSLYLLSAAAALGTAKGWEDPRARRPWETASAAILHTLDNWPPNLPEPPRGALLTLAQDLLGGPRMRVRSVKQDRILEGLVVRRLAP